MLANSEAGIRNNVETLFQTKSIAEVREVEAKTRHEIEEKKKKLREVVGGSYRDLISSADTIIDIARSCHSAVALVGEVQGGLAELSGGIGARRAGAAQQGGKAGDSSYDRLYALGSRVKYLVDTPETIWGCLDGADFLEAARRFVRAAEVHGALAGGGHARTLLARFPLLQHQWPVVKKFKSQIWDRAVGWLGAQGELSSEQLASTLAALALLKPMGGAELLATYLDTRRRYISQCLEAAIGDSPSSSTPSTSQPPPSTTTAATATTTSPAPASQQGRTPPSAAARGAAQQAQQAGADVETVTVILGDVLGLVARAVAQAGELFLALPGVTPAPLLAQVLGQEDLGLADLAFDAHQGANSEIAAWKVAQAAAKERLAGLTAPAVAAQCGAWLESLAAQQFGGLGGRLLGACGSGRDLLAAESGVRAELDAWEFELRQGGSAPVAEPGSSLGAPGAPPSSAPPAASTSSSPAAEEQEQPSQQFHRLSWNDAAQWVLGRPLGLWPLLLEGALVARAKELVARDFTTVVEEVTALLGRAVQEADALPPTAPGAYEGSSWSELVVLQPGTPTQYQSSTKAGKRRRLAAAKRRRGSASGGEGGGGGEGGEGGPTPSQAWLQQTEQALQLFDKQLSSALAAALDACYGLASASTADGPAASGPPGIPGGSSSRAAGGEYTAGRALILEPFVQDRCMEAAQAIAAKLEQGLASLPAPPPAGAVPAASAACFPTAQKALIVGRVALAVAGRSLALRTVLGPPELWRQQQLLGAGRGGGAEGSGVGQLEQARRLGLGAGRLGSRGAVAAAAAAAAAAGPRSARLAEVQQRFRSLGLQSYSIWANWAAQGLSSQLLASLQADVALRADAPLRGWEETVVSSGAGGDAAEELLLLGGDAAGGGAAGGEAGGEVGGVGEMRFWLPAAPSAAAMEAAMGACREANHAGGHLSDDECLALLKWHLAGSMLAELSAALAPAAGALGPAGTLGTPGALGALSEKGVLQLLLDLRFLYDLLATAGGAPAGVRPEGPAAAAASAAAAAATARRRELAAVEEELQSKVDPIDWATYESYLYANKDRFAARCQVLFGLLLRSDQGSAQQAQRGPALATPSAPAADSNVLRMSAGAPRFSYLPVNTPAALRQQSAGLPHSASGQLGGSGPLGSNAAAAADKYSFALFGRGAGSGLGASSGPGAAAAAAAGQAGQAAAAAGGAGVGAAALDALRHSRFGSLLGDKAAEVTAMAQTLGDYSFSNLVGGAGGSAGGLLSSLGSTFRERSSGSSR